MVLNYFFINENETQAMSTYTPDFRNGTLAEYEQGTLCETWVYKDRKFHGICVANYLSVEPLQVFTNGEYVGNFKSILKSKGRLWFLTTFGKTPEQLLKGLPPYHMEDLILSEDK